MKSSFVPVLTQFPDPQRGAFHYETRATLNQTFAVRSERGSKRQHPKVSMRTLHHRHERRTLTGLTETGEHRGDVISPINLEELSQLLT